ncbi:hypothetical protein SAMN05216326_12575 [Nitrosomonas marina]|uniref:Uncharacterized protein n=1 Tax=Nitrosomonas marina TaxID=917 RepID=A0A1I0E9A4_9PROT|nr:hypothetical protein [Nitrosomonas marina]SET41631.1 hypothetical protein SAMN05216326_12575 [Nitrosomonas marina]
MNTSDLIKSVLRPDRKPKVTGAGVTPDRNDIALDMAGGGDGMGAAENYTMTEMKMAAASAIQQWIETDDLDDGESSSDRLLALMVGIADENKDGDITDDEQDVLGMALEAAWDYLSSKGVEDDDIDALLNDFDDDAAERVRDLVASVLPEGEDAESEDIDSFAFDSVALDAAYKRKIAVRGGKKVRIRKRVSGTVRLSAKQKLAIRKARRKSHSASAKMRRAKSMRVRKKAGLK